MSCPSCSIVGDGPIADEVNQRKDQLPPTLRAKFEYVYNIYETDEGALTADQASYIFFCATYLVQVTAT